jgi:hypothetical protein
MKIIQLDVNQMRGQRPPIEPVDGSWIAGGAVRRSFKYQTKGFFPCAGTMRSLAEAIRSLTDDEIKKQVEMSPAGGQRIVRFD